MMMRAIGLRREDNDLSAARRQGPSAAGASMQRQPRNVPVVRSSAYWTRGAGRAINLYNGALARGIANEGLDVCRIVHSGHYARRGGRGERAFL